MICWNHFPPCPRADRTVRADRDTRTARAVRARADSAVRAVWTARAARAARARSAGVTRAVSTTIQGSE